MARWPHTGHCAVTLNAGWRRPAGPGWTTTASRRCTGTPSGPPLRRKRYDRRPAIAGTWQAVPAALGAERLHAEPPRRARSRAGRAERRREDDPAAPGHRAAQTDD